MEYNFNVLLNAYKNNIEYLMPSEIAEKYRVLSTGKYKGQFRFKRSPYTREIVDTISPENSKKVFGFEKGSQIGLTMAGIANMMLSVFKQYHGDVLFMSDTDEQVKRAMSGFIDDMIRESGLGGNIGKLSSKGKKTTVRNNVKEKKFGANTLYSWSGQTIGKLSSISPKYSFNDECERYKFYDKKAGSPYTLIMNRHKTYGDEYKAYFVSTPEEKTTSIIHPIFEYGDKRYYHIPCKECGELIKLDWYIKLDNGDKAGIVYKREPNGDLIENSVGYICPKCGGFFNESHKLAMYNEVEYQIANSGGTMWYAGDKYLLKNGNPLLCQWIPTAKAVDNDHSSYHVSALYSGGGFHTWKAIVKQWLLANPVNGKQDVNMIKTFYNQELGLPTEEKTVSLENINLSKNCRLYDVGVIPDLLCKQDGNGDIILLTLAVDLNGKMTENVEEDDVRLDYEVVAWTTNGDEDYVSSYSIDQGSIGTFERHRALDVNHIERFTYRHGYPNSVWNKLDDVLNKEYPKESGKGCMKIAICGIDTGHYTIYANEYVRKNKKCVALKGDIEKFTDINADKTYFKLGTKDKLYRVENNIIKDKLAEMIILPWKAEDNISQPQGYMNYPEKTEEKYRYRSFFKHYEGEHKIYKKDTFLRPIGMKWEKKSGAEQHFFDCRVYNIVLQKIISQLYCKSYKVNVSWQNCCRILKQKQLQ